MNTRERFRRMREVERQVNKLVVKGWRVRQVVYDDEEDQPLYATIVLAAEDMDHEGVVI